LSNNDLLIHRKIDANSYLLNAKNFEYVKSAKHAAALRTPTDALVFSPYVADTTASALSLCDSEPSASVSFEFEVDPSVSDS
jgi:hypothetical protein